MAKKVAKNPPASPLVSPLVSPLKTPLKTPLVRVRRQQYDTSNNNDTDTVTVRSNNGTGFKSFWEAYPYKVRKAAAQQVWEQLQPDATLCATILAAIEQHKRSSQWQKECGRYIPNPAKWLSERRWEDKLPEVPATESGTFNTTEFAEAALAKTLRDFGVSD